MTLSRRQVIAEMIAEHGDPVVQSEQIPIGKTLQAWEPGLPYVTGAVMRIGSCSYWYCCPIESRLSAIESGDFKSE